MSACSEVTLCDPTDPTIKVLVTDPGTVDAAGFVLPALTPYTGDLDALAKCIAADDDWVPSTDADGCLVLTHPTDPASPLGPFCDDDDSSYVEAPDGTITITFDDGSPDLVIPPPAAATNPSSVTGAPGDPYIHDAGDGSAPVTIEALDNGDGSANVLGCAVSTEDVELECDGTMGFTFRKTNLKDGSVDESSLSVDFNWRSLTIPSTGAAEIDSTTAVGDVFQEGFFAPLQVPTCSRSVWLQFEGSMAASAEAATSEDLVGGVDIFPQYTIDGGATWINMPAGGVDQFTDKTGSRFRESSFTDWVFIPNLPAGQTVTIGVRRRINATSITAGGVQLPAAYATATTLRSRCC